MSLLQSKFVEVSGITINYGEGPRNGPDLVFLHGFPGAWSEHEPVYALLVNDFHIVAPTMRGLGLSAKSAPYPIARWIDETGDFIRTIFDHPVLGVGHSAGSWFGLAAAGTDPGLFSAFVSLDQPLNPETHIRYHTNRQAGVIAMAKAMRQASDPAELAILLRNVPASTGGTWADLLSEDEILEEAEALSQHDPEIFAAWVDDGLEAFIMIPELQRWPGEYRGPIVFLDGDPEAGSMVSSEGAAYNLERYPWAEHVRLEGLNHLLGLWDEPSRAVAEVRRFFQSVQIAG